METNLGRECATDFDRDALIAIAEHATIVAGRLQQHAQNYYAEHKGEAGGIDASMAFARDADSFAMIAYHIGKVTD